MNYTYMVECSDHTLYTGWTNDLDQRIRTHNEGKGAKYTRSRLPVTLVYVQAFDTKQEAMSREFQLKRMKRQEKLKLIASEMNVIGSLHKEFEFYGIGARK